ncbi:hypothetical protein BC938DRAFT_471903 [Jimgerdemannia flammicorona]|uniref:Chitin-binding type-1 domain-containing protein n=1 Tax=Jimgerdemannia flammicorona TaxID=994334 RepID=A0A433Q742_9FUNG|nr:hypothetical protein BC938DRAFT_471903 [Jimgerdemannia flammicorona]
MNLTIRLLQIGTGCDPGANFNGQCQLVADARPNQGASCPSSSPCCSQYGYCGSISNFYGTGCDPAAIRMTSQHNSSVINAKQFPRDPVGGNVNATA